MATFHFDLVSPAEMLFSGEVNQVDMPGVEGDFGVLANHAPMVSMLRPGVLVIFGQGEPQRIVVNGGFAEIGPSGVTVLAEMAVPRDNFDRMTLADQIKDAEEDVADETDGVKRDRLARKLAQLKALQAALAD